MKVSYRQFYILELRLVKTMKNLLKVNPKSIVKNRESESKDYKITTQEGIQDELEYEIVEKEILPEKMICPDCGGITLVGLDFCDKCGGELINRDN